MEKQNTNTQKNTDEKSRKIRIANFISFLPVPFFIIVSLIILFQFNQDKNDSLVNILLISFLIALFSSEILKKVLYKKFKGTERPEGAIGTDFFSRGPDQSGKPGFPSGHMSMTSAVCFTIILFLVKSNYFENTPPIQRCLFVFLNIFTIFIMGWARHIKKCHNLLQICGGTILGTTIASLLFFF